MDKVGRYRIERRLGAGSFATVWLGHDDELDVPVAVKVLAENWSDNTDVRNRFLAEARIMRRIRDQRLVQVYDIGTLADGRPYFVMDYVDGGSLDDLRRARVEPGRALRLCADACRAIDVLHENDIIHRDVTPGNLLLATGTNGRTRVLVADLGVAKSMVDEVGATMTAGTPSYMAPEQAAGGVQLDRRADIYSLTAVTYAMLAGTPPFPVRSIADILGRQPDLTPTPLAERVGAPSSLDAVLVAGLAADRNRRPPTALLLAQALDTVAAQLQAAAAPPVDPDPTTGPGPSADPDPVRPPEQPEPAPVAARAVAPLGPSTAAPAAAPAPGAAPHSSETTPQPYAAAPGRYAGVAAPPAAVRRDRGASYYVLLAVATLALFALSMFVTIVALR